MGYGLMRKKDKQYDWLLYEHDIQMDEPIMSKEEYYGYDARLVSKKVITIMKDTLSFIETIHKILFINSDML